MTTTNSAEYSGKILRVDLTDKRLSEEALAPEFLRKYVGGTGIGARILYDEVPPGTKWSDAENRLILATGPLAGTRMGGSGTFSVCTKGCLTDGGTATQANGYLGAYLRFNGLVGLVFQGAGRKWVYLYIHDGKAELRDAEYLLGKDTWETEDAIKKELGKSERELSVFSIGPAGENLVKFAGIVGDKGHAAAHNGSGAVMGSKRLKAIAVSRGKGTVAVNDKEKVSSLAKQIHETMLADPSGRSRHDWGTSMAIKNIVLNGQLPVKNLETSIFSEWERFLGTNYREAFEIKPSPCWACPTHHLHMVKVKEGPYAGYVGEEPEYEAWAGWGPLIGVTDIGAVVMLSNEVDRLGMDTNEASWLIACIIDGYERGALTRKDTDGLEMTWGNSEAARAMLHKIARRDGFGNVLAEGLKRAAEQLGGEVLRHAVYLQKGNAPRGHDHRARWSEMLDTAVSGTGTIETGPVFDVPPEFNLAPFSNQFSPVQIPYMVAKYKPRMQFIDCLGVCNFVVGPSFTRLIEIVNAATGWNLNVDSAINIALRNVNLLRAFNIRHGISPAVEAPSTWYSSIPVDGPAKGVDVKPAWNNMLDAYYQHMGWDRKTGKPLPETLRKLGLEAEIGDLW